MTVSSLIPSMLDLLPEAAGGFAAGLLEAVLNGMWQGVLLTGLVAVVLKVIRRPNAATRFVVWWACLLMVVLLPAISYGWRLGAGWLGERGASAATLIGSAPAFLLPGGFWPVVITLTWAAVSTYLLLRLGAAYAAMQRLKRRSEPLSEDDEAIGLLVDSHPSLPRVVLRRSDGISSPITAGLAHPMILLPNQVLESLSRAELRHIVLHELTHVERNDDRIVLVQRVIEALFFFHPAVFWIGRRLDLEREIACDHRVAALTGEAKAYARCLTRLAELQPASRRSLLASGALLSRRHLVRRVRVLLEDSRQRGRDLVSGRIALGGTVGCLAVVAWFATLTPVLEIPAPRTSDGMLASTPGSPVAPPLAARLDSTLVGGAVEMPPEGEQSETGRPAGRPLETRSGVARSNADQNERAAHVNEPSSSGAAISEQRVESSRTWEDAPGWILRGPAGQGPPGAESPETDRIDRVTDRIDVVSGGVPGDAAVADGAPASRYGKQRRDRDQDSNWNSDSHESDRRYRGHDHRHGASDRPRSSPDEECRIGEDPRSREHRHDCETGAPRT